MSEKEARKIPGEEEYEKAIVLVNSGHQSESILLLYKSASLNYPPSFLSLFCLSIDKKEIKNWQSKAKPYFNLYESKAQDGKPDSLVNLGICFHFGIGTEIDLEKAVELYTKAADQGYATAQSALAYCYENGMGVPEDINRAIEFYTKAAEQGLANAQFNLGVSYENGIGVPQDVNRAIEFYTKAAEQGDANAQFNLALCYDNGEGVPRDATRAAELYSKAAEQGHISARLNLGVCYQNGEGVPKDLIKSAELYTQAAEQGHATAQCNLGICYYNGIGVPKDTIKAIEFLSKAAEQGHATAQFNVGICYSNGDGVPRDLNKAAECYAKGVELGFTEVRQKNVRDLGAQAIANTLKVNNTIKKFQLSGNYIGDRGLDAIAEMLKVNNSLQVLDISANNFIDISKLGDALKCNKSLTELVVDTDKTGVKILEEALKSNMCLITVKPSENSFESPQIAELLKQNEEIQTALSKRIFKCKNAHLSLLDYKILERVNVAVIFENVWKLHQTQQTGKSEEEYLREYLELISLNRFSKYFLFILGVCKLNQIPPFRSHLLGIPKEILTHIGSFLKLEDFAIHKRNK